MATILLVAFSYIKISVFDSHFTELSSNNGPTNNKPALV